MQCNHKAAREANARWLSLDKLSREQRQQTNQAKLTMKSASTTECNTSNLQFDSIPARHRQTVKRIDGFAVAINAL